MLAALGLTGLFVSDPALPDSLPMFLMAAGATASGILVLPSAAFALWRVLGKEAEDFPARVHGFGRYLQPRWWIFALPVVLLLGYLVTGQTDLAWLLLPPLHVLAVGLPVAWLLNLAVRGLPLGSRQRMWGVFGSGLVLAPTLVLIVEGVAGLLFLILAAFGITNQPELMEELISLSEWLVESNPSPELIVNMFSPYLYQPGVVFSVLVFGSVIVPLIEEIFKPIGVWLLVGRNLQPAAGFAAGALSGAGYALFESLALTSGGEDWAVLMMARIGTAVVHILTSGMTGWALVLAWQRGRYLLLGVTYLGAVCIHGLWNALTLFYSFAALGEFGTLPVEPTSVFELAVAAPYALGLLALGGFLAMMQAKRALASSRREMIKPEFDTSEGENRGESVL